MDKKLKIRLIIAPIAIVAAAIVVMIWSGLIPFWFKGTKHIVDSGDYKINSYYSSNLNVTLKSGESVKTDYATISLNSVKSADNGVITEFTFKNSLGFSNGRIVSAKPLSKSSRDYLLKVIVNDTECEFISQTYSGKKVTCTYRFNGSSDNLSSIEFKLTNFVLNEYTRT